MAKYIPEEILKTFLHSYEKGDVWKIHSGDRWLTIFFHTDRQIKDNEDLPIHQQMKEEYYKLVDKYLELRLSDASQIIINFDSKENFDKKYKGNWYNYYH
jgi:hypothetical protein